MRLANFGIVATSLLGFVGLVATSTGVPSSAFAFDNPRVSAYCLGDSAKSTVVRVSEPRPSGSPRLRWYQIENRGPDGRRVFPPILLAATWENSCDDWSHCDRRVARLLTTTSPPVLIVGQRRIDPGGDPGITSEKIYGVYDVSRTGVPLKGIVSVKVPPGDFRNQRGCLEKLKGVPFQWVDFDPVSQELGGAIRMVVEDVRFFPLGKRRGAGIRAVPTGEMLATVTVSETWFSLISRRPLDSATLLGVVLTLIGTVATLRFRR